MNKRLTFASTPHTPLLATGLTTTLVNPARKQLVEKLKHIIGDCRINSISHPGLISPLLPCCVRPFQPASRSLTSHALSALSSDGNTMLCWAPSTMAVRLRTIPAYQSAGPDQCVLGRVVQEREAIRAANIARASCGVGDVSTFFCAAQSWTRQGSER